MAKITWSSGDTFTYGNGMFGITVTPNDAILVSPGKGRGVKDISRGSIPENAVPAEIRFAFEVVRLAI